MVYYPQLGALNDRAVRVREHTGSTGHLCRAAEHDRDTVRQELEQARHQASILNLDRSALAAELEQARRDIGRLVAFVKEQHSAIGAAYDYLSPSVADTEDIRDGIERAKEQCEIAMDGRYEQMIVLAVEP